MKAVIGDVHGAGTEFDKLCAMLCAGGYDDLYCVGDLFDRGNDAYGVWRTVHLAKIKCTMGNHERKMLQFLTGERSHVPPHYYWAMNDLRIHGVSKGELIKFLHDLRLAIPLEVNGVDFVIAHAGVDPENPKVENLSWNVYGNNGFLDNEEALGMGADVEPARWWDTYDEEPFIVYGHLSQGPPNAYSPRYRGNSIGIDTCACSGGPLTAYSPDNGVVVTYRSGIDHVAEIKKEMQDRGGKAWAREVADALGKW